MSSSAPHGPRPVPRGGRGRPFPRARGRPRTARDGRTRAAPCNGPPRVLERPHGPDPGVPAGRVQRSRGSVHSRTGPPRAGRWKPASGPPRELVRGPPGRVKPFPRSVHSSSRPRGRPRCSGPPPGPWGIRPPRARGRGRPSPWGVDGPGASPRPLERPRARPGAADARPGRLELVRGPPRGRGRTSSSPIGGGRPVPGAVDGRIPLAGRGLDVKRAGGVPGPSERTVKSRDPGSRFTLWDGGLRGAAARPTAPTVSTRDIASTRNPSPFAAPPDSPMVPRPCTTAPRIPRNSGALGPLLMAWSLE